MSRYKEMQIFFVVLFLPCLLLSSVIHRATISDSDVQDINVRGIVSLLRAVRPNVTIFSDLRA